MLTHSSSSLCKSVSRITLDYCHANLTTQRLKLKPSWQLILHPGTLQYQTISGGRPLGTSASISPRYLLTTIFQLTDFCLLQTLSKMCNYTFFSKDSSWWDECYQSLWGCHNICLLLEQFQVTLLTQPEVSSLSPSGV